jgi:FkbM family methyltransferase
LADNAPVIEELDSIVGPLLLPHFDPFIRESIRLYGWWEYDELEYIWGHLEPGMWAIDVGAHVGFSALAMAQKVVPAGRVIALEPEPLNFELLCRNVARNGEGVVVPIHAAGGEKTGSCVLERSPENSGDHRTTRHPLGIAATEVPMVALDDILPPLQPVHFVMTDCQGYDHRVLEGMGQTLRRWKPRVLCEFWPVGILGTGTDPDAVLDGYRSLGYRLELLDGTDVNAADAVGLLEHSEKDHLTLLLVAAES